MSSMADRFLFSLLKATILGVKYTSVRKAIRKRGIKNMFISLLSGSTRENTIVPMSVIG